jgi:hypothetical protein
MARGPRFWIVVGSFVGLAIMGGETPHALANSYRDRSICELSRHPGKFDGKRVQVSGTIESDGQEYTLITDSACPSEGLGIEYSNAAAKSPTARRLRRAIFFTGTPGTQDKIITVTLAGRFYAHRQSWPKRLLVVESVSNLVVRPK